VTARPILLAAGGTGGHLFPAAALAQELKRRGYEVELATDERVEKYQSEFPARAIHLVPSATFASRSPVAMAKTFARLFNGYLKARHLLSEIDPLAVIGFGGYPTLPPIMAARSLGAKHPRIIVRELLPNVVIPMAALALLGVAVAVVAEGALAFLGLSVDEGTTWGKLIQLGSGRRELEEAPWIAMIPIAVLFLTVLALNFAGDRLRSYFDVRESAL